MALVALAKQGSFGFDPWAVEAGGLVGAFAASATSGVHWHLADEPVQGLGPFEAVAAGLGGWHY